MWTHCTQTDLIYCVLLPQQQSLGLHNFTVILLLVHLFFNCKHYSIPHDLFQNFFYSYWSFPFSISGDLLKGISWHASNPSKILDSDTSFVQSNFCHLFWQFVKFKAVFVSNFDRPAAPLVLISVFLDKFFINFVKKWITNFIY